MDFQVDVWLRGTDFATTHLISGVPADTSVWTDQDVATVLKQMLLAIYRAKNPEEDTGTPVFLRSFSWIVNPFEESGVVIAIEIQAGAAVAGPFKIDKPQLEGMIMRAIALGKAPAAPPSAAVH